MSRVLIYLCPPPFGFAPGRSGLVNNRHYVVEQPIHRMILYPRLASAPLSVVPRLVFRREKGLGDVVEVRARVSRRATLDRVSASLLVS